MLSLVGGFNPFDLKIVPTWKNRSPNFRGKNGKQAFEYHGSLMSKNLVEQLQLKKLQMKLSHIPCDILTFVGGIRNL